MEDRYDISVDIGEGKDYTSQVFLHGIELNFDLKDDKLDLKTIEDKAYNFWRYVEDYFGAPPKE